MRKYKPPPQAELNQVLNAMTGWISAADLASATGFSKMENHVSKHLAELHANGLAIYSHGKRKWKRRDQQSA